MQSRMKNHRLKEEEVENLLKKSKDCILATQCNNGYPYAVPMNFIYHDDKIYMHGLPKGEKIDNIKRNSKVCVEVHEMLGLLYEDIDNSCDVNVEYNSVIILGNASILTEKDIKKEILKKIVSKYTPKFSGDKLPRKMIENTAVIEVEIKECAGKYYK